MGKQFVRPYLKNSQHKKGWWNGSSGGAPAYQELGREFKPSTAKKKFFLKSWIDSLGLKEQKELTHCL
jgi:hypothetical protein